MPSWIFLVSAALIVAVITELAIRPLLLKSLFRVVRPTELQSPSEFYFSCALFRIIMCACSVQLSGSGLLVLVVCGCLDLDGLNLKSMQHQQSVGASKREEISGKQLFFYGKKKIKKKIISTYLPIWSKLLNTDGLIIIIFIDIK